MKKAFSILRLATWTAKKFNESHPTYQLDLKSSIKLENVRNAMMIIFSIDFFQPQGCQILQFQVNKIKYNVVIKYSETIDECTIEVIISQEDGQQKLKEKKRINKWSYVLCMVALTSSKEIHFSIDGAFFTIPIPSVGNEITSMEFGKFLGSIKDIYVMNKAYDLNEIYKTYFDLNRKMGLVLEKLGENKFIYTLDKNKTIEASKNYFWGKDMKISEVGIKKIRSISFNEGIQQLGGFPSLLFLVTRIINNEKSEDLVNFLSDFFEFLKLLLNESDPIQSQKLMLNSTIYFG